MKFKSTLKCQAPLTALLGIASIAQIHAGTLYTEDFTTTPNLVAAADGSGNNFSTIVFANTPPTVPAPSNYIGFNDFFRGQTSGNDITITTSPSSVIQLGPNTNGQGRTALFGVFVDISTLVAGDYETSFNVDQFNIPSGNSGDNVTFSLFRGAGISGDGATNSLTFTIDRRRNRVAPTIYDALGTAQEPTEISQTPIIANGNVIVPFSLTADSSPGDFLALFWASDSFGGDSPPGLPSFTIDDICIGEPSNNDPVLAFDATTTNFDYNFGDVPSSETQTITYVNNSISGTANINFTASITDDGSGTFSNLVVDESIANDGVLVPNETVAISVTATNSTTEAFLGALNIETSIGGSGGTVDDDFNDKTLALQANSIADGEKLNLNPLLDIDLSDWLGDAVHVTPGIAGGSVGMARVPGAGGFSGTSANPSSLTQTAIPNGAEDFEFTAFFTPVTATTFGNYLTAAFETVPGPDGALTDRTFQWVLLGSDDNAPNSNFGTNQAANAIINLAYLPDGITTGGTPDFYVYDGIDWIPTGIGAIVGSTDNDLDGDSSNGIGDGTLDTTADPLDDINAYRLLVQGTGFGTPSASYTITVSLFSGTDSFTSGTSTALTAFHGLSGFTNRPTGHAFTTADSSDSSNSASGRATPFWVDDTCFFNVAGPAQSLTVLSNPELIEFTNPTTTGSTSFDIRNDGASANLDISSITFSGGTGFTVTSPAGAFSLTPGEVQSIDVQWDSTATSSSFETANLIINSNDPINPATSIPIQAGVSVLSATNILDNGDFEIPGASPTDDTDTFASWDEITEDTSPLATNIIDVPGLAATSTTAAHIRGLNDATSPGGGLLAQNFEGTPLTTFTTEFDFAISAADNGDRQLSFTINALSENNQTTSQLSIRYLNGVFQANNTDTTSGSSNFAAVLPIELMPSTDADGNGSLNDVGDELIFYRLLMTNTGWGTSSPSTVIEVFDSAGVSLGASEPFTRFRVAPPINGSDRADELRFSATQNDAAPFWIDEVNINGRTLESEVAPPADTGDLAISVFSIDPTTGAGSVTFGPTEAGDSYELQASNNLTDPFVIVGTAITAAAGETTAPFTDPGTSSGAQATRFYRVVQLP